MNARSPQFQRFAVIALLVLSSGTALVVASASGDNTRNPLPFPDASGLIRTFTATNQIDISNPFFASLGSNGRSCSSCHQQSDAWTVSAQHIRDRFENSKGLDPIFRSNDGANCPTDDTSTLDARRRAYSQLLSKGLIRVSRPIPANADFALIGIDDPYNCASSEDLGLYRRPLPATNLRFLTTVMWDGRQSHSGNSLEQNLGVQATDATLGHAQAAQAPTSDELQAIVAFEMGLSTAQAIDAGAGSLSTGGIGGGPEALAKQEFYLGINDVLGADPSGKSFNQKAMTLFSKWEDTHNNGSEADKRASIARGEALFNTFSIAIRGVKGLNDKLGLETIPGTCTTCHDTPNVGNHSLPLPIDIGLASAERRTPDMPLYTFRCNSGEIIQVTDPGRALSTGKCEDIGKFKGPILRALAARAPYFHNGSAATLMEVVEFYNVRFNLNLNSQQKADLVAFLSAL